MTGPGRVTAFDPDAGLGQVMGDDGRTWAFQCTAIADGSRRIDIGRRVLFTVGPGGPGRWEARHVAPVDPEPDGADVTA